MTLIAVFVLAVALMGLLLWGMRRDPAGATPQALKEIRGDDPAPEPSPYSTAAGSFTASLIEDRRLLSSMWGPDTPDLLVAFWSCSAQSTNARGTSYRQIFLPLERGLHEALAVLENELFEGALEQGIPERSRLLTAYTFIHLPGRRQEVMIQSAFTGGQFEHQFHLMDSEGKPCRIMLERDTVPEELIEEHWMRYRHLVAELVSGNTQGLEDLWSYLLGHGETQCHIHAWCAFEGMQGAMQTWEVRRHLSFAMELDPENLIARIEKAKLKGASGLREISRALREHVAYHSDRTAQTGFLLAQSLVALHQAPLARLFCEALLLEAPDHPGASGLLRLIDQRERGAQT